MHQSCSRWGAILAALTVAGLVAARAGAQNLDPGELAAALALPIVTGGQAPNPIKNTPGDVIVLDDAALTLHTITNGRSTPVLLRLDAISGDPPPTGDVWQSDSFDCLLTGRETVTVLAIPAGAGAILFAECSTPHATGGALAEPRMVAAKAANGILWVAAADPATGTTVSEDVLFGDAVVVDAALGQAYSFSAINFQAGQEFNDGDKIFRFDNQEYARWPSTLAANFIAPTATLAAELILFTLDGTTGNPTAPRASVSGLAYNDDELYFDFQHEFDCFDIVPLAAITPNFTFPFLGSLSGHLQLVPQPVGTVGTDVHDASYGDANNSRRRPVHGWIVQSVQGALLPGGQPIPGAPALGVDVPAAWARPLTQGRGALVPFLADQDPTLDTDPLL